MTFARYLTRYLVLPIRLRIAVASTLATTVLLLGAGLLFLTTLRSELQQSLDSSLRLHLESIISQVDRNGALLAGTPGGQLSLSDGGIGEIVAANGAIALTTETAPSPVLLNSARLSQAKLRAISFYVTVPDPDHDHDGRLRVLAQPFGARGEVVVAALSGDVVEETIERAGKQLLLLGAIVLLIAAPGSWFLARAALAPVERMRRRAARLQASDAGGGLDVVVSRDEVGRLGATLNDMLARLHAALERERAFVADAGHELRTPLTVLKGELELAQRPGRSREELLATVEVASEETERLVRLTENLLVLARDERGRALRPDMFDLAGLVADAVNFQHRASAAKGVTVTVLGPSSLPVRGEPERIRQAVDNVLSNALRAAPVDSSVQVLIGVEHGRAEVHVRDEGGGFGMDLLPVAFERFRRADASRSRSGDDHVSHVGSGLGLAITRSALRAHGGDARARNRAEGGAEVTLWWPSRSDLVDGDSAGAARPALDPHDPT